MKIHVQLDDGHHADTVAFTVDTDCVDRLPPGAVSAINSIIVDAVEDLVSAGVPDAGVALTAELIRRVADVHAYRREAARRGVLPL